MINARNADVLAATAEEIRRATGVRVTDVAGDIATEEGRAAVLSACPEPDILVNNGGGPPPGDFRDWGRDDWLHAIDGNMLTPIALIKATIDGMIGRRFGRIVNITSSVVKAPAAYSSLGLSAGARCGLTGFVAVLGGRRRGTTSPSTGCCRGDSTPTGCVPIWPSPRTKQAAVPLKRRNALVPRFQRPASARPKSYGAAVHSCAVPTPDSSLGKTSCWTGEPFQDCFDVGRIPPAIGLVVPERGGDNSFGLQPSSSRTN